MVTGYEYDPVNGYELLRLLTQQGRVFHSDLEGYIGIASDGEEVLLGVDERATVEYLTTHPTPDTW